jgi:hypothetical protein
MSSGDNDDGGDLKIMLKRAKLAKSDKPMQYALVAKGSGDGVLLVSKKKVSPQQITDAKKKCAGKLVARGGVFGEEGKIVFQTPKPAGATLTKLVKLLAKREAQMAVKPEFRLAKGEEDEADEVEGEEVAEKGSPLTGVALRKQLLALDANLSTASAQKGAPAKELKALRDKASEAIDAGKLDAAAKLIEDLEDQIDEIMLAEKEGPVSTGAADLAKRMKALSAEFQQATALKGTATAEMQSLHAKVQSFTETGKGKADEATEALTALEKLVKATLKKASENKPLPEKSEGKSDAVRRISALKADLEKALAAKGPDVWQIKELGDELKSAMEKEDFWSAGQILDRLEPIVKKGAGKQDAPNKQIEKVLAATAEHNKRWTSTLKDNGKQPRDYLYHLDLIAKEVAADTKTLDGLVKNQLPNVPPGDRKKLGETALEFSKMLAGYPDKIEKARQDKVNGAVEAAKGHLQTWQAKIDGAGALTKKPLLQLIEEIEAGLETDLANLKACGAKAQIDPSAVKSGIARLKERYAAELPKRKTQGKPEPKPIVNAKEPDEPTEEELTSIPKIYEKYSKNWFVIKKKYQEGVITEEVMTRLWAYRQKVVFDYMKGLKKFGYEKKNGWDAVGSTNLESDIDISINKHYIKEGEKTISKYDFEFVKDFNDHFFKTYNAQPGIMFDTNLYASAKPIRNLDDQPETPAKKAMNNMTQAGQDIGALMKQRRYMSWEEYDEYMESVLKQMKKDGADAQAIEITRKQFEEADGLYQVATQKMLENAQNLIKGVKESDRTPEQQKAIKMIEESIANAAKASPVEGQKILLKAINELTHFQDVTMWANNEMYTAAVKEVRDIEIKADGIAKEIEEQKLGPDSPKAKELASLLARARDLGADAVFFANEAYHSEGPFKHIVEATQGAESDVEAEFDKKAGEGPKFKSLPPTKQKEMVAAEQKKRRDALSLHQCLQSFNEQLGDFLKDLEHYQQEEFPGMGFYRSSKYLVRLFDAAALLIAKAPNLQVDLDMEQAKNINAGILAARKGALEFKDGPDGKPLEGQALQAEIEAFATEEIKKMFGVSTLKDLGVKFKKVGTAVNAQLRKMVADEMKASKEEEKAYFKNAGKDSTWGAKK